VVQQERTTHPPGEWVLLIEVVLWIHQVSGLLIEVVLYTR
jgi:hypothetical protein